MNLDTCKGVSYTLPHNPPMSTISETITIRIPRSLRISLKALAEKEDLTVSQLLRRHLQAMAASKEEVAQ